MTEKIPGNVKKNISAFDVEETVFVQDCFDQTAAFSREECSKEFHISDGTSFEEYSKMRLIGIGGMGAVFETDDPALDRKVALKLLRADYRNNPGNIARFIREARVTAKIDHPNIVSVHRLGVLDEIGVYFTMKRVFGETLRAILSRLRAGNIRARRIYTLRRLLEIFIAGCNGVAAAHAHGILHCDLKPGNLMIGNFGEVLVLDWGVASEMAPPGPPEKKDIDLLNTKRNIEGTPIYMAPELLCGEVFHPDEQTDVYGLGCILYSILCWGKAPFDAENVDNEQLIMRVAAGDYIPLNEQMPKEQHLPRELAAVCAKAMARDRLERYQNVNELLADIYNYLDGYPVSAYSPGIFYHLIKLIRRRPLIPSVLLAASMTLGAYHLFNSISEYVEESSIYEIIDYNMTNAEDSRHLARRSLARLQDPELELTTEQRRQIQQQVKFDVSNATLQYSSALDLGSRLRPSQQRVFIRAGGAAIFKKLLDIQLRLGNTDMAQELVKRFPRQWGELFYNALKFDPALESTVSRIVRKHGAVSIIAPDNGSWLWTIDNVSKSGNKNGEFVELSSGIHKLDFLNENGKSFTAMIDVQPGSIAEYNFSNPPQILPGMRYIPDDGFMTAQSIGDGRLKQRLEPFAISEYEVTWNDVAKLKKLLPADRELAAVTVSGRGDTAAVVTKKEAEIFCRAASQYFKHKFSLPSQAEWEKAMFSIPGKAGDAISCYGVRRREPDAVEWFNADGAMAQRNSVQHSEVLVRKAAFRLVLKK